jgi:predicted NUDIX family phosphoesterase
VAATPPPIDFTAMEFVFVVPRNELFPDFYPHGFLPFVEGSGSEAAKSGEQAKTFRLAEFEAAVAHHGFFVERAYAERQPELKQVIPYSVIDCSGRVLLFRRLATGGESRLHHKHSIGIGGHINPEDLGASGSSKPSRNPIDAGTRREVEEELAVRGTYLIRPLGILNDDSNPVGAVHVGVVQLITVQGSVEIREKDQLEGRLVEADELGNMLAQGANFETWSGLLIPRLDEILSKPIAVAT